MLNELPEVLVVLNHPFWDIERIGDELHRIQLKQFIAEYSGLLHALEINGYRSWAENAETLELAKSSDLPIVSGGDRHGCTANATVNLSSAQTFGEFVGEVRYDQRSSVLLMPEYRESLALRMLESAGDILRFYPQHPRGRQHWTERVFLKTERDGLRPLSYYWKNGGPGWVRAPLWAMRMIGSRRFRPAMRLVWSRKEEVTV
jgi:hypothetical protein